MMRVQCSIEESLYRPEAVRWRERMKLLEPIGEAVVILPCSMKKPYSTSRSHQIFRKVTRRIQEVILTSPFAICPREMENTYPISSYDVSTTGRWSWEEKKVTGEVLSEYVKDRDVIAHVTGGYREVCEEYLDECKFTCINGKPTSKESMENLKENIRGYKRIPARIKLFNGLKSIAKYQFGEKGANIIPEDFKIKGRYNKIILDKDNNHLHTLMMDRGLYVPTLHGGRLLADLKIKWVEIDFKLDSNTLFAPGVVDADPNIIPGDEVIITRKEELVGVGKAILNGEEMIKAEYGVAVKVRHRTK
jgi:archaeosine synthase